MCALATATSSPTPRRGRPGHDQESMLAVIVEVFTDHGYDASSLEMISRRLGLSKSAVYHHFSSKAEMLELALDQVLGALEQVFESAEAKEGAAVARIRYIVRAAVMVACEQRAGLVLLLRLHGNSEVERQAMERRRILTASLSKTFEAAQAEGNLRDDLDPGLAARFTFGLVNSLVEWHQPDGPITPDVLADTVLAFVRSGLRVNETHDFR